MYQLKLTGSLINPKHQRLSFHSRLLVQLITQQTILIVQYLHKKILQKTPTPKHCQEVKRSDENKLSCRKLSQRDKWDIEATTVFVQNLWTWLFSAVKLGFLTWALKGIDSFLDSRLVHTANNNIQPPISWWKHSSNGLDWECSEHKCTYTHTQTHRSRCPRSVGQPRALVTVNDWVLNATESAEKNKPGDPQWAW